MTLPLPLSVPFPLERRERFIKQFEGPDADSDIVCFRFWQLAHAWGCPFSCSYCFLQANPFARFRKDALRGMIYTNWRHMLDEVDVWLTARTPRVLVVGELQDGLAFDNAYKAVTGKPLTHHLVPLFAAQTRHRLLFLTKSTLVKHALALAPTPQVVFSWSVNADYVARRWESGAPSPGARFRAAGLMKESGWPVRVRLDPMVPYADGVEHWRDGYAVAVERINALAPEMVTLGALRATNRGGLRAAAAKNGRPTELFDYLTEKDPSGFKWRIPFARQVEMYRFALEGLDRGRVVPALCKEDASVWRAVGLTFGGCHCLHAGTAVPEELVSGRGYLKALPVVAPGRA
jgi:spore photoproduct lyase